MYVCYMQNKGYLLIVYKVFLLLVTQDTVTDPKLYVGIATYFFDHLALAAKHHWAVSY